MTPTPRLTRLHPSNLAVSVTVTALLTILLAALAAFGAVAAHESHQRDVCRHYGHTWRPADDEVDVGLCVVRVPAADPSRGHTGGDSADAWVKP